MSADNNEQSRDHGKSLAERSTRMSSDLVGPTDRDASLADRATRMAGQAKFVEAAPPNIPGRFEDAKEIGRGGMGIVWKVRDVRLDRWVAIKRVLPKLDNYDAIVARFLDEAKSLARVSHPNIVGIFEQDQDEFGPYIVMEYVEGVNLLELIKEQTVIPIDAAVRLVRKVCQGLHEAHRAGIIHRDIKPSNILIDRNGRAKLTDFGLARLGGSQGHSISGQVLGTEGYMAPEQYENPKHATAASDQYSLAATLYHMVTGRSPRMIHLRHVPDVLQDILARALDEHADKRFASIAAFHDALGPIRKNNAVQASAVRAKVSAEESTEGDSNLANLFAELRKKAEANLRLARKCFEEYKDAEAIGILNGVPEELRDKAFEQQVKTRLEKGSQLEKEIGQRVREMRIGGLRQLVGQFLELYPNRADMIELLDRLPQQSPTRVESPQTQSVPPAVVARPLSPAKAKLELPQPLSAPFDAANAKRAQASWAEHLSRPVEWTNSIGMKFRLIPPGEFLMGAANGERGAPEDEKPQHKVRISKPLYLGIYPVTQEEYQKVTGTNPSDFKGESSLPVENVSWHDAQAFLNSLSAKDGGHKYRLPTEAEWEYACRAGTTTPFWFGTELNGRQANSDGNRPYGTTSKGPYLGKTTPVGKYGANPFGIFDQHGQVWEWCQDWYADKYYQQFANQVAVDPSGPASGSSRCLRGGSWRYGTVCCRSTYRLNNVPARRYRHFGFRVVCELC